MGEGEVSLMRAYEGSVDWLFLLLIDTKKLPLGKLSKVQIAKGLEV